MKRFFRMIWLFTVMLLFAFFLPNVLYAVTLDVNGEVIKENEKKFYIKDGITIVSEDFLKENMYLVVEKEGGIFKLSNIYNDFLIEGTIGSNVISFNNEQIPLPIAVIEKESKIEIPFRPIIQLFGDIEWSEDISYILARYDYNEQLCMPDVELQSRAITFDIKSDSGIAFDSTMVPIQMSKQGLMIERRDQNGQLIAVETADGTLIEPVHKNNIIYGRSYSIEDEYLYWIESPKQNLENTGVGEWYLYIQERKNGSEPICIDQGNYRDLQSIPYGEAILSNCDFCKGNIVWRHADHKSGKDEIRLYQHKLNKTTLLDAIPFNQSNDMFEIAVGENDAVWTHSKAMEGLRQYGNMYRMDLKTGKIQQFSKGYNLLNPNIIEDKLIVRMKPQGNNFIMQPDGSYHSGELCVYDLKKDEWKFKITNHSPLIGKENVLTAPVQINDTYITLLWEGIYNGRGMALINLDTGKIYEAKSKDGRPLPYSPYNYVNKSFIDIFSEGSDGSCMMKFVEEKNGEQVCTIYPVFFEW